MISGRARGPRICADDVDPEFQELQEQTFAEDPPCTQIITGKVDIFDEWIDQGLADIAFDGTELETDLTKEGTQSATQRLKFSNTFQNSGLTRSFVLVSELVVLRTRSGLDPREPLNSGWGWIDRRRTGTG